MGLGNVQGTVRANFLVEAMRTSPMGNITKDIRMRVKQALSAPLHPPRLPVAPGHKVDVLV